uniref:hypothetical protein n=1 Tax=Methanosarcina siciliae TaxID=38027 RepID=UPI001E4F10C6|nr:hypothetical protein [Methanosarcina siciliae]
MMESDAGTSSVDGRALFPLYTITFIGTLRFGIILTFLVFLVTKYGGNALVYGALASTDLLFSLSEPPFWTGGLACWVFLVTLLLFALFFARALDGVTGGNVSVANAYLADLTSEKERNKNYGRIIGLIK